MKRTLYLSINFFMACLLVGCSLPGNTPGIGTPTLTLEAVLGERPAGPTAQVLPVNLVAFYPLTADLSDLTGNSGPASTTSGSPSPDGFYCNAFCDLTTPDLTGFNIDSFTIQLEFLVTKYPVYFDPVFVAGEYRFVKFLLLPDGAVALGYNNDQEEACSVRYQLSTWHEAAITFDGTVLDLYLDGTKGCSVAAVLDTGGAGYPITLRDQGYGTSFSGLARNLRVFDTVEVPQARTPLPVDLTIMDTAISPADVLLASCPTAAELAAIDADLRLVFESDPSAGRLVCSSVQGSRDLTSFQRIVYTTLLVMKKLEFNQPLPWTDEQLYPWFVNTVDGIRFRSDITYSYCCDPEGMINIQTDLAVNDTNRWIDPQLNTGADGLLGLFVHEARHNEFGGHTCGTNDNTRAELGAWGVQYYLDTYLASNLKDPAFLAIPEPSLASYYSQVAADNADRLLGSSFCQEH